MILGQWYALTARKADMTVSFTKSFPFSGSMATECRDLTGAARSPVGFIVCPAFCGLTPAAIGLVTFLALTITEIRIGVIAPFFTLCRLWAMSPTEHLAPFAKLRIGVVTFVKLLICFYFTFLLPASCIIVRQLALITFFWRVQRALAPPTVNVFAGLGGTLGAICAHTVTAVGLQAIAKADTFGKAFEGFTLAAPRAAFRGIMRIHQNFPFWCHAPGAGRRAGALCYLNYSIGMR